MSERGRSLRRTALLISVAGLALVLVTVVLTTLTLRQTVRATEDQVFRYDPATARSQRLLVAFLDQETGVRGYALSGEADFLQPYQQGQQDEADSISVLHGYVGDDPRLDADIDAVAAAVRTWRAQAAQPLIDRTRAAGPQRSADTAVDQLGKRLFDELRAKVGVLTQDVVTARADARDRLHDAQLRLIAVLSLAAALVLLLGLLTWLAVRRQVIRPIARLAADSRRVAGGDLDHVVAGDGPAELRALGEDIEAMRVRIVRELEEAHAARRSADRNSQSLARSNADLEQFAYVASHDLQEPLRKVSNFCQLLERQYAGGLDDRARQYIGFAVDGAKRMQVLINDLLAFSRVGRTTERFVPVDTAATVARAAANLDAVVAELGARIALPDGLPTLPGDESLLVTLFQNLLGNALKYHGEDPPEVELAVSRLTGAAGDAERQAAAARVDDEGEPLRTPLEEAEAPRWLFTVTDNGIGIEPQYADRIFVIFQRLHLRDRYGGTGIGLALCKKIVEFHGGSIWLDTQHTGGARFRFTLPEGTTP